MPIRISVSGPAQLTRGLVLALSLVGMLLVVGCTSSKSSESSDGDNESGAAVSWGDRR
jgi:hypothetical protein